MTSTWLDLIRFALGVYPGFAVRDGEIIPVRSTRGLPADAVVVLCADRAASLAAMQRARKERQS